MPPTGLFITRVQPGMHAGQIDGLQQALTKGIRKIIIGIGSANKEFTTENPFTYDERKKMVELSCKGIKGLTIEILPIPDFPTDEERKNYIIKNLPPFDTVITGNPRTREIFQKAKKKILRLKIRKEIKGEYVRANLILKDTKQLKNMLPVAVVDYLMKIHASARLGNIFQNEHKTPNLCVDMIFKDKQGNIVLEERKNYPHGIALPGGFVNYGEDPKDAIVREIQEETGATVRVTKLIGVYGDPHRDPRAHNVTIVYEGTYISGTIKSGDDAKKIVKMKPNLQSLKKYSFVCDHKKILTDYLRMK